MSVEGSRAPGGIELEAATGGLKSSRNIKLDLDLDLDNL